MSTQEAPPPPNYGPIAQASEEQARMANEIAKEQLAWAKETYAGNKEVSDKVVQSFLDSQDQNMANAAKDRARYESVYQPLEDQLVSDAQDYSNPARRAKEMGAAQAAVAQQFDAQRQNATRDLESFGINPSDTRYAALDIGYAANKAASMAAASNQAGDRVDAIGRALRSEAINVGRGYPGQVVASYGTGNNAGTGAVNSGNSTFATGSNAMTAPGTYTGQASNSIGQWGNIVNTGYQNQLAAFNANQNASSGLGSALGFAASLAKPFIFAADGGAIDTSEFGDDGGVPPDMSPSRGKAIDDVPARLTAGEFVFPKDVASWYGEEKMHKLIEKARNDRAETEQRTGAIPDVHPAEAADAIHRKAMPRRMALPVG